MISSPHDVAADAACRRRSGFHRAQEAFDTNLGPAHTEALFRRIDADGDGSPTVDELLGAVREYYTGTDEDAPGNLLFGAF
ncbi:hypothetical protein NRK68_12255 [Streptomyces yangpuensis]|uniref:EF-hand domain-containing protein n=1 Tax=Streptomyces yangpuensis TaxID=1648182 RepID=A0ABY5PUZ7_9ACTN|nr:hypothetical protein [Streptomyces yangpuensis]UUY47924.1 hypothetical protein NRK68_12255 [Streptomyces yangpuensis]